MAEILDPSTLPEDEFLSLIQSVVPTGRTSAQDELPSTVAPQTQQAMSQLDAAMNLDLSNVVASGELEKQGARPGVFLNPNKGVRKGVRASLGLDENQMNQFKVLMGEFGEGNVDIAPNGSFVIRNQPTADGGVEDVMVNPVGVEWGDMASFASQAAPMIAGSISAYLGGKAPVGALGKVITASLAAGVGGNVVGGAQDWAVRLLRGDPTDLSEISSRRAELAAKDAAFGIAAAGGAKLLDKTLNAALGLTQVRVGTSAARDSQKALKARTGVEFELSPGQEAESKLLMKLESYSGGRPGSGSVMDKLRIRQVEAEDELRRAFLDMPRTMTDQELMAALPKAEAVGQKGMKRLGQEAWRIEGDVADAAENVLKVGTAELQQRARVNLASPLNSTAIGNSVRERAVGEFKKLRSDFGQRYDEFLSQPQIRSRTIPGDDIADGLAAIKEKFVPAIERTVQKEGSLLDRLGRKTVTESTETEPLKAFMEAKFQKFMGQMERMKGGTVSVNDLKIIRTSIDDSIAEGKAIPGVSTAQLNSLRDVVDNGITSALKGMDDPALLGTWNELREGYARGMGRFDKVGIRDLLIKEGEKGSLGGTEIAESFIGSSPRSLDHYNAMKEFLGPDSSDFKALQQVAREKVLSGSLGEFDDYVVGRTLRGKINSLRPEVAKELFGAEKAELNKISALLDKARGNLDQKELEQVITSKSFTAKKIEELLKAEDVRRVAYNNSLIKAAKDGTLGAETIRPSEFVRHAVSMDPEQAQMVMGVLKDQPELIQEIKQIGVEMLWDKARTGVFADKAISSTLLNDAMGGSSPEGQVLRRTWRAILGNDTVDGLQELVSVVSNRDFAAKTYAGGGRLAGASDVNKIFMQGEAGAIRESATRFILAFLYSGPLKRSVTNIMTSQDRGRFLNAVIMSSPFMAEAIDQFGSDGALAIIKELRSVVEPLQRKELFIQGQIQDFDPTDLSAEEFEQWINSNVNPI